MVCVLSYLLNTGIMIYWMNFCPCLKTFLTKLKGKEVKASYEGPREFEEEEFMNPHQDEPSLSDTITH